jgi:hypothetical protein
MIIEMISILAILIGGVAFVNINRLSGPPSLYIGFITGIAIYITIGAIQVISGMPTSPILTLIVTATLPGSWWLYHKIKGKYLSLEFMQIIKALCLIFILVAIFRYMKLTSLTPDSFYYLTVSSLLFSENISFAQPFTLLTRLLAVPLIHSPANYSGEFFLPSITPILAISTALSLAWFCQEGLRGKLNNLILIRVFSIVALGLLISNNRFIFHTFYINGHLLNAALILFISGGAWFLISQANVPRISLYKIILVAIPALVVTRPESSLYAVLALLPLLFSKGVPFNQRIFPLIILGFSITAWHGFLLLEYSRSNIEPNSSVVWMLFLGIALIILSPIIAWLKIERRFLHILYASEAGLWLALALVAVKAPRILYSSLLAAIENIVFGAGGWGISLIMLGIIFLIVIILTKAPNRIFLRFPLTTFIPLSLLLAYIRGSSYRVGYGDSLNRMLLHILPLAILFIVSAAASEKWGLPANIRALIETFMLRFKKDKVNI